MAYKLVIRKKLRVPVKGTLKDEDGKPVNFNFVLLCDRLTQTEIDDAIKNKEESVKDFVQRVTNGWEDVLEEGGAPIPFDADTLAAVLEQAGMPVVCYQSYLKEVGAVVKN
jgi:benzoyl-CoA reductase/2-hydroxyglutaryl-CoA dehydratase subunit BcrC/BadD/HgdB